MIGQAKKYLAQREDCHAAALSLFVHLSGSTELELLRILRREGCQTSEEFFHWLAGLGITQLEGLEMALHYTTPHIRKKWLRGRSRSQRMSELRLV